jgi:hypothetical protein
MVARGRALDLDSWGRVLPWSPEDGLWILIAGGGFQPGHVKASSGFLWAQADEAEEISKYKKSVKTKSDCLTTKKPRV